jgi:hypothetical protein
MFSNNEITEKGLLHRALARASSDVTMEERTSWAHSIDRAINEAVNANFPLRFRVARRTIVLAAAPALVAVAAALRDDDVVVSREALDAVRDFMTDGIDSPLYGGDPLAARRAADAIRRSLFESAAPQRATAATAA